ncbi:efflux RND transporter permease subunit [Burkholderia thailandensis]|nr:efflux RND transporter permease subunit [Burkholderia thailandensis]MCS6494464.1 efflux RND transporter permease subunit [Burkholderia thailandensis]MCS6503809.1 efflux RND transporter permease subunit [Burkholderia thailandensis]
MHVLNKTAHPMAARRLRLRLRRRRSRDQRGAEAKAQAEKRHRERSRLHHAKPAIPSPRAASASTPSSARTARSPPLSPSNGESASNDVRHTNPRHIHAFIAMAITILLATPLAPMRTPTDVPMSIDMPVISMIGNYNGLSAQETTDRITSVHERTLTTTVGNIQHLGSRPLRGIARSPG